MERICACPCCTGRIESDDARNELSILIRRHHRQKHIYMNI